MLQSPHNTFYTHQRSLLSHHLLPQNEWYTYAQVPTNTVSTPALVSNDTSIAKVSTNAKTMPETAPLLIDVKYKRKIGISKIVTATQTAASLPTKAILALEKKWTAGSCTPWTSLSSRKNRCFPVSHLNLNFVLYRNRIQSFTSLTRNMSIFGQRLRHDSMRRSKGLLERFPKETKSSRCRIKSYSPRSSGLRS
jgi:hypothetical protein